MSGLELCIYLQYMVLATNLFLSNCEHAEWQGSDIFSQSTINIFHASSILNSNALIQPFLTNLLHLYTQLSYSPPSISCDSILPSQFHPNFFQLSLTEHGIICFYTASDTLKDYSLLHAPAVLQSTHRLH